MMGRRAPRRTAQLALAFVVLLGASQVHAAVDGNDIIDTIAGGGIGDGFPANVASVEPDEVSVGPDGSIYIAESARHRIRRIDPASGFIETIAGIGAEGFAGDGGPATLARLRYPTHAVADAFGNLYICDQSNHRIRKVDPNGIITTVAGSGQSGAVDGPALSAKLYFPRAISVDPDGNVLIAEPFNHRIRMLSFGASPQVTTVAGTGLGGFTGDGGAATSARLQLPSGVWSLGRNTFLIADRANQRIRKVESSIIRTVAGNGTNGFNGDGNALSVALSNPISVSGMPDGSFVIADQGNNRARRVTGSTIQTVAGTGTAGYNGDGIAGGQAQLSRPFGITAAGSNCIISDYDNRRIRRLNNCAANGTISTIAGISASFNGDGHPALVGLFVSPNDVAVDAQGNVYIADGSANRIRRVRPDGYIETYAGTGAPGFSGDGGPAINATFRTPNRIALEADGDLLVLDSNNRRVRRIDAGTRRIETIAGNGEWGNGGDGGSPLNASFTSPTGLAVDSSGRIYISDASRRIRRISGNTITTIAGTGQSTGSIDGPGGNPADDLGDNGPATSATFTSPSDVAVDSAGNVYISDMMAHRVRRIDVNGIIRPVAGTGVGTWLIDGEGGNSSDDLKDGSPAVQASINSPAAVDFAANGDILIADRVNRRVRMIRNGVISTLGGNSVVTWAVDGEGGASHDDLGDGEPLSRATFNSLSSLFVDPLGNLWLTDSVALRLRVVASGEVAPTATSVPTFTPVPPTPTFTSVPPTPTRTNTPGSTTASVSGRVRYYANQQIDVPNVAVDLNGPGSATVQTDSRGSYNASNIPIGSWNLAPGKSGGFGSAISSLDAARVLQVIAGLQSFTSTQRLACDVTGDGALSALDAVRILQFSAGIIERMPVAQMCGSDWLFDPEPAFPGQTIPPIVAGGVCEQGRILISSLTNPAHNQNFDAILFGDCTGNWGPAVGGTMRRTANPATVHIGKARHARAGSVRYPVYVQATAPFNALDLAVSYDGGAARFAGARLYNADSNALVSAVSDRPGIATVSLASGAPIDADGGVLLLLEFTGVSNDECTGVRLAGATVDERPARVITHPDCD